MLVPILYRPILMLFKLLLFVLLFMFCCARTLQSGAVILFVANDRFFESWWALGALCSRFLA
jgi:hypothetical protein